MPQPMTFAVAGYGAWGRFHARSIANAPDGRLIAIAAPSEANANAAKSDFPDATVHRQWEALIDDPAIEAIAVATPNHLHAPIAVAALEAGANGVGLFRSEFLFMGRTGHDHQLPTEDEQFIAYRDAVVAMKGRPVTIRTLDVGADKPALFLRPQNP